MAREVTGRVSPRSNVASSKAARKDATREAKKAALGDTSRLLGKIFTLAVGAILLPAMLLASRTLWGSSDAVTERDSVTELQRLLVAARDALTKQAAAEQRTSSVVALSGSVSDFVAERPEGALVEFYMPNCEHCQKLKPDYEAAAKELAALGGPPLASINGEAHPEIAKEHNVSRYPTVLWFRRGEAVQELRPTSRTKEKIMEFVEWVQQPAFTEFETRAEMDEAVPHIRLAMKESSPPVVVGFATSEGPAVYDALERVAERFRGKALFLYVKEEGGHADIEMPPLRSYSANADDDSLYTGPVSPDGVQQWVESLLPLKKEVEEPGSAPAARAKPKS